MSSVGESLRKVPDWKYSLEIVAAVKIRFVTLRDFNVGCAGSDFKMLDWKDFTDHAMQTLQLELALNHEIVLNKYGKGITSFNYIPIVVRPTNKIHEEEINYSAKKKRIKHPSQVRL